MFSQLINKSHPSSLALKLFWVTNYCLFFELTKYIKIYFSMVKIKSGPFKDMKVKFTIFLSSYCFRGIFSRFNSHGSDIKLISHST